LHGVVLMLLMKTLLTSSCVNQWGAGHLIAAPHLPFPGIGYVARNGHGGYAWVPVTYTDRAATITK
ncbi:hypothetical protein KSI87_08145, partial [Dickeya zeae]|nr:hypothetical protein [Dickeya zeae]